MGEPKTYTVTTSDPDLMPLDEDGRRLALAILCTCGHPRRDHYAATGAFGSFGGSACSRCWVCGTFTADVRP